MIDNDELKAILLDEDESRISIVCEVYSSDAVPTADGFDPADAIECYAAVSGITFRTRDYKKLVKKFGSIKRTITGEINTTSVEFCNLSREIRNFEFQTGFEGLILVIRLLSRSASVELTDTQILFAGRCEKPKGGKKESLSVTARFILDSVDVNIPRRKFQPEDPNGRDKSDPLFEGFIHDVRTGSTIYTTREKKSFLWIFHWHKTVSHTLQYSSHDNIDANMDVPEVFGYAQLKGIHLGFVDIGTTLQIRTAFCEGEIEDIINTRSIDSKITLSTTNFVKRLGKTGTANGPDDPSWVAPGLYSRTAHIRVQGDNSALADDDPAPDIVAIIKGRLLPVPDEDGDWSGSPVWTPNPAAVLRYLWTGGDYYSLPTEWVDNDAAVECFNFNAEEIFNISSSDFLFLE